MYCPNCNKTFADEFTFCDTCGAKLEKEQAAETVQPADPTPVTPTVTPPPAAPSQPTYQYTQTPPPAAPVYQAPAAAEENKKISKTVSFGTWMGIHFLNIIPFMFSVLYTVLVIISTPTAISNSNPLGLVILALTVLYVILLLIWAIGKPKARSLKNYAKATLLMALIVIVIMAILFFVVRDMVMDIIENIPKDFELPFDY